MGSKYGQVRHPKHKARRDDLRAKNRCINGPSEGTAGKRLRVEHGPVVQGGKCQRCIDVHRRSDKDRYYARQGVGVDWSAV